MLNRLFTTGSLRPEDMTRFVHAASLEGSSAATLIAPMEWSIEAADSFRAALAQSIPSERSVLEENTMPSWLWRRQAKGTGRSVEKSVTDVFDRIAGAAAYRGWKNGLWDNEVEASVFFDELRATLLTRRLTLAPADMARMGLDWAYGIECANTAAPTEHKAVSETLLLQNETIDAILRHKQPLARGKWARFCENSQTRCISHVAFADTISEWDTIPTSTTAPRAMINLQAFRQSDGSFDITGLQQTARLAVLLLELHYDTLGLPQQTTRPLAIGFSNLAGLLLSLGLAYDSRPARETAAALAAIITSTATTTSAHIASRLGPCAAFGGHRETTLRTLRNRLRAAFGEENDYERLSVRPQTLTIDSGVDLVLISAARYGAEEAADAAAAHGLRHLQVTSLFAADAFLPLLDASSQGTDAEACLTRDYALGNDDFIRRAHPSVALAMEKLGHDRADIKAAELHLTGYRTLVAAPGVSQAILASKGFDPMTLVRLEKAIQKAGSLREIFTPWILGTEFCRRILKLTSKDLSNPSLDILRHLGFSQREIEAANAFACGHSNLRGLSEIEESSRAIFATREDLTPEAQIKMAAAVQGFISGETGLTVSIPASVVAEARGNLLLTAWELGLKSITIHQMEQTPNLLVKAAAMQQLMKRQTKSRSSDKTPAVIRKKRAPLIGSSARGTGKSEIALNLKSKSGKSSLKEKRS